MLITAIISGLVLGGTYALVAMGLTLQYGIARIMNLAYGELTILAALATFVLFSIGGINPILAMAVILPAGFVLGYGIYAVMISPLAKRSASSGALEVDSILASFGLLFVIQGIMLIGFGGGNYISYNFMNFGVDILGATIAANRLLAFAIAVILGVGLYLLLTYTRAGTALRAVAASPQNAPLVGIDVARFARLAFALGTMMAAAGGVMISMYQTFTVSMGVIFTMKALVVVIMGGVGNVLGALIAGLMLGLVETLVATFLDPGLTLAATFVIFLGVLLWKPAGLFGEVSR